MMVKKKTPEESWFGRTLKVNHHRVPSFIAYTWIIYAKRTNLYTKSKKMMITTYDDNHKADRLAYVDTNLIRFSRDVMVDEATKPFQNSP